MDSDLIEFGTCNTAFRLYIYGYRVGSIHLVLGWFGTVIACDLRDECTWE